MIVQNHGSWFVKNKFYFRCTVLIDSTKQNYAKSTSVLYLYIVFEYSVFNQYLRM